MNLNILYFEAVGMDYEKNESSDICNYRIRTSFKNSDGEQYYIELGNTARHNEKGKVIFEWALRIDHLFKVADRMNESYEMRTDFKEIRKLNYTKENIKKWINENLNCNFDGIQILNEYYGYHVHGDKGTYRLMEDIEVNHKRAEARREAFEKIDMEYRRFLEEKYAKISLLEMDSESITIRCYASDEKLKDKPRIQKIPIPVFC